MGDRVAPADVLASSVSFTDLKVHPGWYTARDEMVSVPLLVDETGEGRPVGRISLWPVPADPLLDRPAFVWPAGHLPLAARLACHGPQIVRELCRVADLLERCMVGDDPLRPSGLVDQAVDAVDRILARVCDPAAWQEYLRATR